MFSSSLIDVPRPYVDPISSVVEALGVAGLVFQRPRTTSTTFIVVDKKRRGLHLGRCEDLDASSLHRIIADASAIDTADGVVIVSSRVSTPVRLSDIAILAQIRTMFSNAGIALVDWIVIGAGGVYCPRVLVDAPDPWPDSLRCL